MLKSKKKFTEIIEALSSTSSKNEKEAILREYKSNKILMSILYQTYNPFIKFFVKQLPNAEKEGDFSINEDIKPILAVLNRLSSREVTGNKAKLAVQELLEMYDEESQYFIRCIIGKDLQAGFSVRTINAVFDKLIPEFSVALADTDKTGKIDILDGNWFLSRKLDGVRCVVIKKKGVIKFYSRVGNEFSTLNALHVKLEKLLKDVDNIVLDGEMCILDENGKEDFSAVVGEIKRKDYTIKEPRYQIFDYLPLDHFLAKESTILLANRLDFIKELVKENPASEYAVLDQVIATDEILSDMQDLVKEEGWEGLIARKNTSYKGKRSKDLLKIKKFFSDEFVVLGTTNSLQGFTEDGEQKQEEMMKNAQIKYKGYNVDVGSGWNREQKRRYFRNPQLLIGKEILIQYFEETKTKDGLSLRFPTVKYVYNEPRSI